MASGAVRNEGRRAERRKAHAPSTVRGRGTAPIDVTVEDISRTGIRFLSDGDFAVGDTITIGLAGIGTTIATVAWVRDGACGCSFAEPIAEDAVARAFTARTVVQWAAPAGPAGDDARAQAKAAVEEIYQRHRRWAIPRDAGLLLILLIALLIGIAIRHL